MKTEVKLITPAIAEDLLKKNSMNRFPKKEITFEYARVMRAGLWKEETGEAIKIAYDGTILDGQQRLMAIIKADVKLNFLLITGLEKDVFSVLDTGTKRTSGDIFHIAGVLNDKSIAAGIIKYYTLKKGLTGLANGQQGRTHLSSTELLTLYKSRDKFWQGVHSMSVSWYHKSQRLLKVSEFTGLYAYLYDIDNDDAYRFVDLLANGVDLDIYNPIKLLREKLIFSRINTKFTLTNSHRTALIFKAWNMFRENKTVKFLRFTEQEIYPIPK